MTVVEYVCDEMRHLICRPFSIDGLHRMAEDLSIGRHWYHLGGGGRFPHYDIPKRRFAEIKARCTVVDPRELLAIIKAGMA